MGQEQATTSNLIIVAQLSGAEKIKLLKSGPTGIDLLNRWRNVLPSSRLPSMRGEAFAEAELDGANLWGANLQGAYLISARLAGVSFLLADLRNALLLEANLDGTCFDWARLEHSKLRYASLKGATFYRANLSFADLRRAVLTNADLRMANLTEADLQRAFLKHTILKGANLERASLWRANLSETDLSGALLKDANLARALLVDSDLSNSDFNSANLRKADLRGANLSSTSLVGADLSGVRLEGADLRAADLSDANLSRATYDRSTKFEAIRVATCYGNAIFRRDAQDQDYIETRASRIAREAESLRRRVRWKKAYAKRQWDRANSRITWRLKLMFARIATGQRVEILLSQAWTRIWGFFDYGRDWVRLAGVATVLALLFGMTYWLLDDLLFVDKERIADAGWFTYCYYSIVTYTTLGFGDITPKTWIGQVLVTLEVVLGYITLGLLVSILANRVARRS